MKKCLYCDKQISPDKQYCSSGCKSAMLKIKNDKKIEKAKYGKGVCPICKKEFNKKSSNHKFCSSNCSVKVNNLEFFLKDENRELMDNYKNKWFKIRFEIFKRDNFTCQYCGRNVKEDNIKLHCDHILPRKSGGSDNFDNLITSCQECNLDKGDVLLERRIIDKTS